VEGQPKKALNKKFWKMGEKTIRKRTRRDDELMTDSVEEYDKEKKMKARSREIG